MVKALVLRCAKMPPEPHIPEGSQGSVKVFHPGRNYIKMLLFLWALANLFVGVVVLIFLRVVIASRLPPWLHNIWMIVAVLLAAIFVASLLLTYFVQRLNFEMRWYVVTDRSLRIRRGIFSVEELTMTFANIQEIRVSVNPLQRLLGLADVEVHAAGGGGATAHGAPKGGHLATFESVDNASEIRDLMMERLRVYRDAGLGRQPGVEHVEAADTELEAASAVLREVRALRSAMSTS